MTEENSEHEQPPRRGARPLQTTAANRPASGGYGPG
jgi:hypothetical protein